MVYMLFDNPADKQNMEFLKDYATASFKLIFPQEQCKSIKSMIKVCNDCVRGSSKGDTIICWYDFMGILCWWLCKVYHKKRNIIVLNILLKDKKSLKNKTARFLYRIALKSDNLKATVTSKEYGESINKLLDISKRYTLLHDVYHGGYEFSYYGTMKKNSIFCGGRNGRDWDFLIKLAKKMPDIQFHIVMPKDQFDKYKGTFDKNVTVKTEIPEQEFLWFMCQSSLVIMPLDTEAPAGLTAMFQAAANGKLVIASDTVTTREYFADKRGVLCKKSLDEWDLQIRYWIDNEDEALERAQKFKRFLEKECSERKYAEILYNLLRNREKRDD